MRCRAYSFSAPVSVQGHKKWVLCVAWSPDGEMVATGGMEGALWLWDPKSGNPIGRCKGGPSPLASFHIMQEACQAV